MKSIYLSFIVFLTFSFHILANYSETTCELIVPQEHYWGGGSGDWDDPSKWVDKFGNSLNSIPDADDNVFFDGNPNYNTNPGDIIHLPVGNYEINSIYFRNFSPDPNPPKLSFDGSFGVDTVHLYINDKVTLDPDFDITYGDGNYNRWVMHGANSHTIISNGVDMNYVRVDTHNIKTTIVGNLTASYRIQLMEGELYGDGIDIHTNVFRIYTKPSPAGYIKLLTLENTSKIICKSFNAIWNYGTDSYAGGFMVDTHLFKGGSDSQFGDVYLRDTIFYPASSEFFSHNLQGDNIVIANLTVDSHVKTRIKGNIIVTGDFIVKQEDRDIIFDTRRGHVDTLATFAVYGDITLPAPPGGSCYTSTRFKIDRFTEKKMFFRQSSGTFMIENAIIRDIGTMGNATFDALNCVVYDYINEWDNITTPISDKFYWIGDSGDWHDPSHWSLVSGGTAGTCLPTVFDHVFFNNNSFPSGSSTVTVTAGENNHCRNFSWTANAPNTLNFVTSPPDYAPTISISGDLFMNDQITITSTSSSGIFDFETNYSGVQEIYANNVALPRLFFSNREGSWKLYSDISCIQVITKGGILNTNDKDIDCELFTVSSTQEKSLYLGESTINASTKISFGLGKNATVDADTTVMITKEFESEDGHFNSLTLQNTLTENFSSRTYHFKKLIIDGTGITKTQDSLIVDSLIFLQDHGALNLSSISGTPKGIVINEGIRSSALGANNGADAPKLYTTHSSAVHFNYLPQNLCITGPLKIQKMNAIGNGLVHVPDGVDLLNNTGFEFGQSTNSGNLYWLGGQGDYDDFSKWTPEPGHCPENVNPFFADTLFFTDIGAVEADTVFIRANPLPIGNTMVVNNAGIAVFALEESLELNNELLIDGGNLELIDNSDVNHLGRLRVRKFVHVINGGKLNLNLCDITVARKPTIFAEKSFYVDGTSTFGGIASMVNIAGHTSSPGFSTLEIDESALGNMGGITFQVINPLTSAYNQPMNFKFGGHQVHALTFDNSTGQSQIYTISEDVTTAMITAFYGNVIVESGVDVIVE